VAQVKNCANKKNKQTEKQRKKGRIMKKIMVFAAMLLLAISPAVFGQITDLPSSNVLIKSGSGDINVKVDSAGIVTVEVPFSQPGVPILYRSIARANGSAWAQITDGKYELVTKATAGIATADLGLQPGIYRVRMWGKVGTKYLDIIQSSKFYRLDAGGKNPAYEFIIKVIKGANYEIEVMLVPSNYPPWNQ